MKEIVEARTKEKEIGQDKRDGVYGLAFCPLGRDGAQNIENLPREFSGGGVHRARVPLFSTTARWVRAARDIPMADDSIKEFDGYILGDGEMLSLDDSDRVLAIMREHWSDKS